jgi:DNA-directed RNA polymerase specialized sigma24 family protein
MLWSELGVESFTSRKSDWVLTEGAFELLLAALDSDRERAGEKYEIVRRKLLEFFEARGSEAPDAHADETINRVAKRIAGGEEVQDLDRYFYGVARLVWLEMHRGRARSAVPLDTVATPPATPSGEEAREEASRRMERERRLDCFEACLSRLPAESRDFIIAYYKEERGAKIEQRKRQAEELGVTANALRLRAARLRQQLERCIVECLGRPK